MLRREQVTPDDVFVDLGSGKGRVLLEAARRPFRRVIGVEIAPQLNAIAAANVAARRPRLRCRDIELVTSDVVEFSVPDDVTFAYVYNGFTGAVFERAIEQLIASVDRRPRPIRLLYRAPREHDRLIASGRFRRVRTVRALRPTRAWARRGGIAIYTLEVVADDDAAT